MATLQLTVEEQSLDFSGADPKRLGALVRQLMATNPDMTFTQAIMIVGAALNLGQNALDTNADTLTSDVKMEEGDQWRVELHKVKETQ